MWWRRTLLSREPRSARSLTRTTAPGAAATRYLSVSDGRIFVSALLGLVGIPIECLCWFAVNRMILPYSETEEQLGGAVMPDETETTAEEEFELEGDVVYEPESDYDPAENLTPTVYGPPAMGTTSDNG